MSVKHKYRFYIDDIRVYPVWSDAANLKWEREGEFVFLRLKLNGTFTLLNGARKDFNLVWAQDLDHQFTFRAEYIVDGEIADQIDGTFYKTDCPFWDVDNERVDVVIQTIDRYEKLMRAFDKEFDLVGVLQPEIYKVNYKKEPLIQIAFPNHSQIYNRVGNSVFLQELSSTYTASQLESFGFITSDPVRLYVPGTGDMSPDVSGIYEEVSANVYDRTDSVYRIRLEIGAVWVIVDIATDTIRYLGTSNDDFKLHDPFIQYPYAVTGSNVLRSISDPDSYCAVFPIIAYQRILTDALTVDGDATIALPQPDIGDLVFNYDRYIDQGGLVFQYLVVEPSNEHTLTPTKFGKYNEDALHFADEYFNPNENPFVGTIAYPVMLPSWTEFAIMEYSSSGHIDDMIEAASPIVLRDAYALADVIQKVLGQIDTSISFFATADYSKFLYDVSVVNPISGEDQVLTHFITPKSNIVISDYSQPDTKELITFGNLDNLLKAVNLYWWIDNHGNFRIEHIAYFNNGRSYDFGTPFIGVNLTTLIEPRTGKAWGYHTNNFRYTKEKMVEQFTFGWMDKSSEYFDGLPIIINSGFVEKGLIKDMKVQRFSADLSLAVAFPDNFAVEGFFVFGAEFIGGEWEVPFELFDVGTLTAVLVQNGWWSFYRITDKFWRHNLPSPDANINGVDITAITTKRGKEQNLVFPAGMNPDTTRLVTSGIGNCEIDEMEINLVTGKCKIKALGDLDFDNPCPTC